MINLASYNYVEEDKYYITWCKYDLPFLSIYSKNTQIVNNTTPAVAHENMSMKHSTTPLSVWSHLLTVVDSEFKPSMYLR